MARRGQGGSREKQEAHAGTGGAHAEGADGLLAEGKGVSEVARALEVSEATYLRWRNQFGGTKAEDAKEVRRLTDEIQRLRRMVGDQALDLQLLKEVARGNL